MTANLIKQTDFDAIIIGGGACGLMCAVQAGFLGKHTLILEKNDKVGAKILISGGGRCNYTNLYASPKQFISQNEHFSKSAFAQWTVDDTISFFETYGIEGKEKTLGQLFPTSDKAKDIVKVFTDLCADLDQEIKCDADVKGIEQIEGGFEVVYEKHGRTETLRTAKVIIAAGGLPIQKMGATDFGLRMARKFGLNLIDTAPALVPLTITGKDQQWYEQLSGNSIFCRVWNDRASFEENILFTHWGLSGPAILQISSYWKAGEFIYIDLLPNESITELIQEEREVNGKKTLLNYLSTIYTRKFAEALSGYLPIDKNLATLSKADLEAIDNLIHHFKVKPAGDKGYDKAEVMRGGVSTDELSSKSLEAKKVPGLFFGGECVDVTGWLGGYNFQWAWASGFVIAQKYLMFLKEVKKFLKYQTECYFCHSFVTMTNPAPKLITNYRLVFLLWIAVAVFCWHYKFTPNHYNNYVIFKQVYHHTRAQVNLYGLHPQEYYDENYYGPTFSILIAPFAMIPDAWGFFFWCLFSAVTLLLAIHLLPISNKRKMLLLLFCSVEFANTVHNIQFNTIVTAFIIFSFLLVEKGRDEWATLFIILGALVKIYPIVGIAFFVFSKNKKTFVLSAMAWLVILVAMPMFISSNEFVLQSYADWFHALQLKNLSNVDLSTTQDISIMGVVRHFAGTSVIPNWPFLLFGAAVVSFIVLRFKQYKSIVFRLQLLACLLMMVVLFSSGAEHPTYVIAVTGAVLWIFLQEKPFTTQNIILLITMLIITGLGPTDAFPKSIRNGVITNYVMKAWPCIVAWCMMSYELLFKDFTQTSPAYLLNEELTKPTLTAKPQICRG